MSIRLYVLNGVQMQTREQMHDHLYERFELAAHYGRNLDALWDMLTERREGGTILIANGEQMPKELRGRLLGLLTDLTADGSHWCLHMLSADHMDVDPLVPASLYERNVCMGEEAE